MKKITTIFISVIVLFLLAGKIADRYYKKYWWPFFDKLDEVIRGHTYYDAVYFGDSRVHFGINPYYVDSITGLKSYNAGMGGAPMGEINFLAENYLQQHAAPRFVIISIGYSNLLTPDRLFENPCYYFFYTDNSLVKSSLEKLNYHITLYKILPVLKYTAFDDFNKFSIAENIKGHTIVKPGGIVYNGFINNSTNSFNMQVLENAVNTDTTCYAGLKKLEETIQLFVSKKTIPVLLYPPALPDKNKQKNSLELKIDTAILQLAKQYNAALLHYDNDSDFTNSLFTDPWHLNINGTILYSNKIGTAINSMMKKETAQ